MMDLRIHAALQDGRRVVVRRVGEGPVQAAVVMTEDAALTLDVFPYSADTMQAVLFQALGATLSFQQLAQLHDYLLNRAPVV